MASLGAWPDRLWSGAWQWALGRASGGGAATLFSPVLLCPCQGPSRAHTPGAAARSWAHRWPLRRGERQGLSRGHGRSEE